MVLKFINEGFNKKYINESIDFREIVVNEVKDILNKNGYNTDVEGASDYIEAAVDYIEMNHNFGYEYPVEQWFEETVRNYPEDLKFMKECLKEDTIKQNNKWVNKGDSGKTHGKFKTKKEADAQRKAMFANGYSESLDSSDREKGELELTPILELEEDWNIEDQIDAVDTIGKLNPGDKFKNRNGVEIEIVEPQKDGTIQFKVGDEVRAGSERSIQRMLYKNNYLRDDEWGTPYTFNEAKRLNNREKQVYINALKEADAQRRAMFVNGFTESLQDEDGWGEQVLDILYNAFERTEHFMYEIRNCVRDSYAGFGSNIDDLIDEVNYIADMFTTAAEELENSKQELNESLLESDSKEIFHNDNGIDYKVIERSKTGKNALLNNGKQWIVAWNCPYNEGSWGQGHYFFDEESARYIWNKKYFNENFLYRHRSR